MRKILIVEDELVVRSIYRRKFEMSGYKVETAEEGAAALKLLPVFRPDVIQVDIMMPGMDGVEVIKQIRAWPEFRMVPILVLSSFYRPDLAKDAWKAGASKCVSKMDCTPNLALELVEQLLSGENTGFTPKFGVIPMPKGVSPALPTQPPSSPAVPSEPTTSELPRLTVKLDLPPSTKSAAPASGAPTAPRTTSIDAPSRVAEGHTTFLPKLKVDLNLPPAKGIAPTRPSFAQEKGGHAPAAPAPAAPPPKPEAPTAPEASAKPAFFGKTAPAPFKPPARPIFTASIPKPAPPPVPEAPSPDSAEDEWVTQAMEVEEPKERAFESGESGPDFRMEIRGDFIKRVPLIQSELRERVAALLRSKSPTEQLKLLQDLEGSISSLASLSGITGFSRVSHLAGALDALIKDLRRKPSQMTSSVLRTIAHAMDCMNVLFRDLTQIPQDIPHSMLILAVDDEPISRRTLSVALGKANLRCISIEESKLALTLLKENTFDLIFLDAEMPVMNGFELCAELRKLPTNKLTPVIFVTSLTKFETRAQSSLSGGNDLIAKPFLMMELAVKALTYLLKPPLSVGTRINPLQGMKKAAEPAAAD